jgi:hypothetical protein
MSESSRYPSLKPGYFLAQESMSLPKDALFRQLAPYFQQFRTEDGVKRFYEQIAGKVDGLDYVNYWYTQEDAAMARRIAEISRDFGVELWTGIRWQKQFRDMPVVPSEYAAWTMDEKGNVVPGLWEERNHFLDLLNPDAVNWLCDVLEERYWKHMKGLVQGLFLPEVRVPLFDYPWNRSAVNPCALYAHSPYVLGRWRQYCAENDIRHEGAVVDRFPVPAPHLATGNPEAPSVTLHGITMHSDRSQNIYVPDDRPGWYDPFTRLVDVPKGPPVWVAWENFLCELFHESFLNIYAQRTNDLNADVSDWRGVCFFNHDASTIDYRDFQTREARTTACSGHLPQARRMGVDIHRMMDNPEYTTFIMETVSPPREYFDYEENNLSCFKRIAGERGRADDFGLLLHYCCWEMDEREEEMRWEMIHKYRPPVLSMYTVVQILTEDGHYYKPDAAQRFWRRLDEYKRSFSE